MLKFKNMSPNKIKKKVQVVVLFEDGIKHEVLLLEFNSQKNKGPVGFQNITGSVESGEDYSEAAARELAEEIGVVEKVVDINHEHSFVSRWDNVSTVIEKTFLCVFKQKPSVTISEEHQGFKWVDTAKVTEKDYTFSSNYLAFKKATLFLGDRRS